MSGIPDVVRVLERDLRSLFGDRLKSLVAYGLKAHNLMTPESHAAHDLDLRLVHTLVVVDAIRPEDLHACTSRVASWHHAGLATPLFLASNEFARSLDAFPLEFGAILADHVVVSGANPFEGLRVDAADLRRACEVAARSHLLHLREGYLETRGRGDALALLIVASAAPFSALLQSLARLQGFAARDPDAAGRYIEHALSTGPGAVTDVVKLATVTEISSEEAIRIFPAYLDAVVRLAQYVDEWSAGQ
jgi:hypothetical protein